LYMSSSDPEMLQSTRRVAQLIKTGQCKRLVFLTGAGVSVSAGIPDFRSPGGMYDSLRPELLTATSEERLLMQMDPTAVVSRAVFDTNPLPYLEIRRPLVLGLASGRWKPTITHHFLSMCHEHGILLRLFTQNIDGLDYMTNLPPDKIVSVHGSISQAACEFCLTEYPMDEFREQIGRNVRDIEQKDTDAPLESTPIYCKSCCRPGVKSATVLYGGNMPPQFFDRLEVDGPQADLLFVCGTSLSVRPANTVPLAVSCPRVLVNIDDVRAAMGEAKPGDEWLRGDCDSRILDLIEELGWLEELRQRRALLAEKCLEDPRLQS